MILQRLLSVLTAAFLVAAIALGSLAPQGWPLTSLLLAISRNAASYVVSQARDGTPYWLWAGVIAPFMVRPAWLLPAFIGIVCGGLCLTLASRQRQPSRRRRS